ncbi:MAG: hypothetical protein LBN07_05260 [Christensenellaceae bacterium]|jgi:hypothetical protein|nr:hypothetical protein [Christensenellaceae bacterium]
MANLEVILSMSGTILGLLITVFTFIAKTVSNSKAKRVAEQAIKIGNAVLPFIKEAKKFTAYTGEEKKAYVMTKASQFALKNDIPFKEDQVSEKVEELVELTRKVNVRMKAKEKAEMAKEIEQVVTNKTQEQIAAKSWL